MVALLASHKRRPASPPRVRLWPGLSPGVYARAPSRALPFPLDRPGTTLFANGRTGLWHGIRAIGLRPGDEVLVPAYHCGAEVEVLLRAGLSCRFYEATETLAPDAAELDAAISTRTRALLVIDYFGFPQDAVQWRAWCDRHGLWLIEDCAHALFATRAGQPAGALADLATYSLHKTLPVPSTGALHGPTVTIGSPRWRGLGTVATAKRHAAWAMARVDRMNALLSMFRRDGLPDHELGDVTRLPPRASSFLIARLTRPDVAMRRREHYGMLLDRLGERVAPTFRRLPPGASPLLLPLAHPGERIVDRLARSGVEAPLFWPVAHPALPAARFPRAVAWRERFLALPVHQELQPVDLERIVTAICGVRAR